MNIFVSRPTVIGPDFEQGYAKFHEGLTGQGFVVRRLGGGSYSKKAPLHAVIELINDCCGALVLGYPQIEFMHCARRSSQFQNDYHCVQPTPWNQIEGALAYATDSPVLVIAHPGIEGGIFDHGITGEGVLHLDLSDPDWHLKAEFTQPFKEWAAEVESCSSRRSKTA